MIIVPDNTETEDLPRTERQQPRLAEPGRAAEEQPPDAPPLAAPACEGRVTMLGPDGVGKTFSTVLMLHAVATGQSSRYRVLLGDGSLADRTLPKVQADAATVLAGGQLPPTNSYDRLSFTVEPTGERHALGTRVVRWVDPQGLFVRKFLQEGRLDPGVGAALRRELAVADVVGFVLNAGSSPVQLEVLLRGLDQLRPRLSRRRLRPVSILILVTHWGSRTGTAEEYLRREYPAAMVALDGIRHTYRVGLFGVEALGPAPDGSRHPYEPQGMLEAVEWILDGVYLAHAERRRARRVGAARAVGLAAAVAGALLGGLAGLVLARDARTLQRAQAEVAACPSDDDAGRAKILRGVLAQRLLPVAFGRLEPGQAVAEAALAELEREPERRGFLALWSEPSLAGRLLAIERFLAREGGGGDLAGSARGLAWEALEALGAPGALPAEADPEALARAATTILGSQTAHAARLGQALAKLRAEAGEARGRALVARWDARLAALAAAGDAGAALPEEGETRELQDRYPQATAVSALRARQQWLDGLRAARALAAEARATERVERLDDLAARLAAAAAACRGGPHQAEVVALADALARRRTELLDGALRVVADDVARVDVRDAAAPGALEALERRLAGLAGHVGARRGSPAEAEVSMLRDQVSALRAQAREAEALRRLQGDLAQVPVGDVSGLDLLDARLGVLAPAPGTPLEAERLALRQAFARLRATWTAAPLLTRALRQVAGDLARIDVRDAAAAAALDALDGRLHDLASSCQGSAAEADVASLRGGVSLARGQAREAAALRQLQAALAQTPPGDASALDLLEARLELITPAPGAPLETERRALRAAFAGLRATWAAAQPPAGASPPAAAPQAPGGDAFLAEAGRDHERLEEDVIRAATGAAAFAGQPQEAAHWRCAAWLLWLLDRRVRTQPDSRIVLRDLGAFRELEAAARGALGRDALRDEAIMRVLEEHLPRAVGFRCPSCARTSVQGHSGCGDAVAYRGRRLVCAVHPTVQVDRRVCRGCGQVWRDQ